MTKHPEKYGRVLDCRLRCVAFSDMQETASTMTGFEYHTVDMPAFMHFDQPQDHRPDQGDTR